MLLILWHLFYSFTDYWKSVDSCKERERVLNNREAGWSGNTTVVLLVARHHDVTFLSPARTPAARKGRLTFGIGMSTTLSSSYYITKHSCYRRLLMLYIVLPYMYNIPVLDYPVVLVAVTTIANGQYTVIQLRLRALTLIVDTILVQLQSDKWYNKVQHTVCIQKQHEYNIIIFTWKLEWEASIATEMGPTVPTATWRSASLFDLMSL